MATRGEVVQPVAESEAGEQFGGANARAVVEFAVQAQHQFHVFFCR
jgi:hypothetical protein